MVKNSLIFGLFLIVILINLNSIQALIYDCDLRLASQCNVAPWNNIVMKLSGTTNAHGAIYSEPLPAYGYAVCCNFPGSRMCNANESNVIVVLSAITNAHAENKLNDIYTTKICFNTSLNCENVESCPSALPIDLISLSSSTNAHIGNFSDYSVKICCNNTDETAPPQTCQDQGGDLCTVNEICPGNWLPTTPPSSCCDVTCCLPEPIATTCSGVQCGPTTNNCGQSLTCPNTCAGNEVCQGNSCVCVSDNAAACLAAFGAGYQCGQTTNQCGQLIGCGSCPPAENSSLTQCNMVNGRCELPPSLPTPCTITSASWEFPSVFSGTDLDMSITGNGNCAGELIQFRIYEEDPGFAADDFILTVTAPFPKTNWTAVHTYTQGMYVNPSSPENNDDDGGNADRTYYFKAKVLNSSDPDTDSGLLNVSDSGVNPPLDFCLNAQNCNSYTNQSYCESDSSLCNLACASLPDGVGCGACPNTNENASCVWDGNSCEVVAQVVDCSSADCGNGIQESGEECDGNNFENPAGGNYSCSDFGFEGGGFLICDSNCDIKMNSCAGYDCNPNGLVKFRNETCDPLPPPYGNLTRFNNDTGEVIGLWMCSNFDRYVDGPLGCDNTCNFNWSGCITAYGSEDGGVSIGNCTYSTNTIIECDDPSSNGLYIASYNGTWQWSTNYNSQLECKNANDGRICAEDPFGSWHYSPNGLTPKINCETAGENIIECPAQVRLPFFGSIQFIITLLVIALIYGLIALDRKKK
ncbi:MAG TPA: hypothetical protein VJH92_01475 [Candidatus Nanoarchaeia archaeon]|nr:hypothetical protein [Candidatus Nanoarchaeia archaeon]